ncbi:IQ-domain 11 [Raphanus sativus]|uniref:Protein IQ-DOMAIN 11 n=1 Tax=Raphanus sativus TaxID=3726 RepID=A0A6J0MWU7_RAPSA|nr:protein IQ-DOMAIN 11 [Raphanus sativus]XP_018476274.1 protein IQ-DOMAIN 11 [Raphanus sativus]KAJ4908436.1 IQ-domain 11 [Raphanus sativus]
MTNKKGLFTLLKRVFISEANSEKKEKRRRWTFWKLKVRKRLPTITAPPPENGTRNESHEEQQKEESLSDVGEVSQVSSSQKFDSIEKLEGSTSPETTAHLVAQYQLFLNREEQALAATRIQTAFRGHLARKALRALKGIVKLQAYIRGRAVRRQAMTTLKCLQSVVNIQSQVYGKRAQIPRGSHRDYEESHMFSENILKVDTNGQKRWDDSLLTKEEAKAVVMSKREAALRRERIKEYAVTHRKSAESYQKRSNTKWKYWLDEWVDTQRTKSKELEDLDLSLRTKPKDETMNKTPRNSSPRRLVTNNHRRQASISEEEPQNPVAPVTTVNTPTYMVATESAKAKSRSLSSPRIRPRSFDTQSESYSPYKNKLCLTTSVMSEAPSKVRVGNSNGNNNRASAYQQRSPGLRGFNMGPLKSCNNGTLLNDLSINSERSLPSWSKQSSLR